MSKDTMHKDPTNKVKLKKTMPNENSTQMNGKKVNTLNAKKDDKKNPVVVNKLTIKQKNGTKKTTNIDSKGDNYNKPTIKKPDAGLSSSKFRSTKGGKSSNIALKDDSISRRRAIRVPLKASHAVGAKVVSDNNISSKNIMNQVHNVTISSPPSVRREIVSIEQENAKEQIKQQFENSIPRDRTRTRTLGEDEILMLNKKLVPNKMSPIPRIDSSTIEIKPPISFEVKLEENQGVSNPNSRQETQSDSEEYEDDFEVYESDFDTDISSGGQEDSSIAQSTISSGDSEIDENVVSTASKHPFDMFTSIDDSEHESGSYEMKIIHNFQNTASKLGNQQTEQQNDSGVENSSNVQNVSHYGQINSLELYNKTADNISDIEIESSNSFGGNSNKQIESTKTKSKLSKRGDELLRKITLDVMNYVLFDFKPIPYELFMKIYGSNNMTQVSVQTHNDRHDQECLCDEVPIGTSWTQCPITFYTKNISEINFNDYKIGSGHCIDSTFSESCDGTLNKTFDYSLNVIQNTLPAIDHNKCKINLLNINFEELNRFLVECELTLAHLVREQTEARKMQLKKSDLPISLGFFELRLSSICDGSEKVERIFSSSSLPGFLFTLHREMGTNLNIIALWNLSVVEVPTFILSIWSHVVCIEVHPRIKNVIIAGLHDGSIAFWDISESKHWHPNTRKNGKRFVPTQITTPNLESNNIGDIGPCVALQSLLIVYESEVLNGYIPKQICSLHECGLLILWTILHTSNCSSIDIARKRIDHQSLWGKIEVIQNKLIDLRLSISKTMHSKISRPNSSIFDKTRSYFESELLNDTALRELQQIESVESKIVTRFSCSDMKMTKDDILITTNENFFLIGRKSFKNESFRRVQIDTNPKIKVVHLSILPNLHENIVLVALNDGSVKSLCCDLNADRYDDINVNIDTDNAESSSSDSSLTAAVANMSQITAMNSNPLISYAVPKPSESVQVAVVVPLQMNTPLGFDGKSCAMQNLVQSERRIYDESQSLSYLDTNEYKEGSKTNNNPSENGAINSISFMNNQIILSNSLEMSTWQMLIPLTNSMKMIIIKMNRLCIFDPKKTKTTDVSTSQLSMDKFTCATTLIGQRNEEYLILLGGDGTIQVHQISLPIQ